MADDDVSQLQLHLEPREPIVVYELTGALSALWRQFQFFVESEYILAKGGQPRLLVTSVAPGSIDISFLPDIKDAFAVTAPMVTQLDAVVGFANHIEDLLGRFRGKKTEDSKEGSEVSIRDCDDAISIVKPVAEHGGSQTFNVYKGPVLQQTFNIDAPDARNIVESAIKERAALQSPQAERRQRVPLVWSRLDRNPAKQHGSSPDKGIIDEIDPKPKSVFFTDELSYLKKVMIEGSEQPFQTVYFVDVEVSRVSGKVVSYRVMGYHGSDVLEGEDDNSAQRELPPET